VTARLLRWLDRNLVPVGLAFLIAGIAASLLNSLRSSLALGVVDGVGDNTTISTFGLAVHVVAPFAYSLAYNSAFLIAVGLLLRNWRVAIVGFEGTPSNDLVVTGPDDDKTVWVGKRYQSKFDAELAADALSKRLKRVS
jgi:hypothetical protein